MINVFSFVFSSCCIFIGFKSGNSDNISFQSSFNKGSGSVSTFLKLSHHSFPLYHLDLNIKFSSDVISFGYENSFLISLRAFLHFLRSASNCKANHPEPFFI